MTVETGGSVVTDVTVETGGNVTTYVLVVTIETGN